MDVTYWTAMIKKKARVHSWICGQLWFCLHRWTPKKVYNESQWGARLVTEHLVCQVGPIFATSFRYDGSKLLSFRGGPPLSENNCEKLLWENTGWKLNRLASWSSNPSWWRQALVTCSWKWIKIFFFLSSLMFVGFGLCDLFLTTNWVS